MKKLLALAAFAALAACGTTQSASGRTDWSCDGGAAFSVRFSGETAEVFAGGQLYRLPASVSGSGARYSGNGVEFWEHQGTATLNGARGGPYTNCRRG
jgi:membrane-bound inhibitor of C-type lysozyme